MGLAEIAVVFAGGVFWASQFRTVVKAETSKRRPAAAQHARRRAGFTSSR